VCIRSLSLSDSLTRTRSLSLGRSLHHTTLHKTTNTWYTKHAI